MNESENEEQLLSSVALQNSHQILLARRRAEEELIRTKQELEALTDELGNALRAAQASLRERDGARAEAEESRLAAQKANEAKSRFLHFISHELRTPLGAIAGYTDLLETGVRGPLTEAQMEFVIRIRHNQKHLLGLVDELLDVAKIEAGRIDLNPGPVPVRAVLESVQRMIEPQIMARELELRVDAGDSAVTLYADRERVEQIVLNLLSNAVKFTERGGSIEISASATADRAFLRVTDTGTGIPADKLEAVFEPFVQANPSHSDSPRGTGLGLTISRQLARAMNGDVTVESTLGAGTTFTLSLPRALT